MQLEKICLSIQDQLVNVEEIIRERTTSTVPIISQVVQYIIQNGGKRVRPAVTLLAARMCGYNGDATPPIAAAMEMVHTASLMHDDVVDNATTRRGKPSSNVKWGNQLSVLVGDYFWCKACEIIVQHGDFRLLRVITDTITGTTEGEVLELTKSNDVNIHEEEYLKIVRYKTGILLSACGQAGAILGRVSETLETALKRFGSDLGVAFQLADDVLDYVSEESRFGKSRGTDLREGKLTLPLIMVLKRCGDTERSAIKNALLSQDLGETDLLRVTEILHKYEGLEYARRLAQDYVEKAKAHLNPFKPSFEKESMLALADYVIAREE